jgi:hypothetical protein
MHPKPYGSVKKMFVSQSMTDGQEFEVDAEYMVVDPDVKVWS